MENVGNFVSTRNVLVKSILPKYVKGYMKRQYYPVVIGGYDVLRCVESRLPMQFTYTDIDMPFVIVPRPPNPSILKEVIKARKRLLTQLITDTMFQEYTRQNQINIVIDDSKSTTHVARLVQIVAEFKNNERLILMDIPIWASDSTYHLGMYETFFPDHNTKTHLRHPVPIYMHDGVPYATCKYLYYDTTRMMAHYKERYENSTTSQDKQHNFEKLVSYGVKYVALYSEMFKMNNREMLQVFAGFEHLLHLTKSEGLKSDHKTIYDRIMSKLSRMRKLSMK